MKHMLIFAAAAATMIGGLAASAQAAPLSPITSAVLTTDEQPTIILASGGCGPAFHRGPYGGCRPNFVGPRPFVGYGYGWRRGPGWRRPGWGRPGWRRHR